MQKISLDEVRLTRPAAGSKSGNGEAPKSQSVEVLRLNLGCGPRQMLAGHINVDIVPYPGVDVVQDLFSFPWKNLEGYEGQVDRIVCSHLVEHIPHDVETAGDYPIRGRDGFYCFFYEAWKLLKPGGNMLVIVPHARTDGAFQDPTHRRFMVETSFGYLDPEANKLPYELEYTFKQVSMELIVQPEWEKLIGVDDQQLQRAIRTQWNVLYELRVVLAPVK